MDSQWDFDLIDDRGLVEECNVNASNKITTKFEEFKTLVFFDTGYLEPETAATLLKFINSGARIIVLNMPDTELTDFFKEIKEKLIVVQDIAELINYMETNLKKDFQLTNPDKKVWYLHKKNGGNDLYFIYNRSNLEKEITVNVNKTGKMELFYPLTGERKSINNLNNIQLPEKSAIILKIY